MARFRDHQLIEKKHLQSYEKALVCLANGYGIGAFAYFRRIVENNISELLDLLQEDAKATGAPPDILESISGLRKESPMKDKISIANKAVPSHLIVSGLNPLGRLYALLSDGVHGLSDEQCLEKAAVVKDCLRYLVSELATRKAHREQFVKAVGKL
jgi:hypothetical protein